MAELQIRTGEGEERTVPLENRPVTFGRDASQVDVALGEQRASRLHCTFEPVGEGWRVVDNQSSNGTWLGGCPVLAARLQPGDELEIGETVITYWGKAAEKTETPRAARRPRTSRPPWGALAVPVLLAAGAFAAVGWARDESETSAERAWERIAEMETERARLAKDPAETVRLLRSARDEFSEAEHATAGLRRIEAALAIARSPGQATDAEAPRWRKVLDELDAAASRLSASQRRVRLADLLSRYVDDPAAVAEIADRLRRAVGDQKSGAAESLASVESRSREALSAGRFGEAVAAWEEWLLVSPPPDRTVERRIAQALAAARRGAGDVAQKAVADAARLKKDGRADAAEKLLAATAQRIEGTGWDAWFEAVTGRGGTANPGMTPVAGGPGSGAGTSTVDPSTLAREKALLIVAEVTDLAGKLEFDQALTALERAIPEVTDDAFRRELESRAEDLRAEGKLARELYDRVAAGARGFGVIDVGDERLRVEGASPTGISLAGPGSEPAREYKLAEIGGPGLRLLLTRAKLPPDLWLPAALLLHDAADRTGYMTFLRRALEGDPEASEADREELRKTASRAHARVTGCELAEGGFMPHPEKAEEVLPYHDWNALRNAGRIAELKGTVAKIMVKIAESKQQKSIDRLAETYAKLEAARDHALELIFDEEKYFYPYRNRMREYAPVQHEVDQRVKAVQELWADETKVQVRADGPLTKFMGEVEALRDEVAYLGGDADELVVPMERLRTYLGRKLDIRSFFVSDAELEMHEYNARVMRHNERTPTKATNDEKEQVRITNEYRMMFGHRRAVVIHDALVLAARGHSDDMARLGFFDHFSPVEGKKAPQDRVKLQGYPMDGCSENIHMGSGSAQGAHDGWARSSGHHRNILSPDWVEMGTGRSGRHWTQNFGVRQGPILPDDGGEGVGEEK